MRQLPAIVMALLHVSLHGDVAQAEAPQWGAVNAGLRGRVVPVSATMSEEAIDPSKEKRTFDSADDVAFVFEVENVSDRPIKLVDTRFRGRRDPAPGIPHSDWFSQFLFRIQLDDAIGHPTLAAVHPELVIGEATVAELAPGQHHRFLIRPARWVSGLQFRPKPGRHTVSLVYTGLPVGAADAIRRHRPKSPLVDATSCAVAGAPVSFEVRPPADGVRRQRRWGKPRSGLRSAVSIAPHAAAYAQKSRVALEIHVQNVTREPITICSPLTLSSLKATIKTMDGKIRPIEHVNYLGERTRIRLTLLPKQIAIVQCGNLGIITDKAQVARFRGKTHRRVMMLPGQYTIHLAGNVGDSRLCGNAEADAKPIESWSGTVASGITEFVVTTPSVD